MAQEAVSGKLYFHFLIFEAMELGKRMIEREIRLEIISVHLERQVTVDIYLPPDFVRDFSYSLLLINDGQDMETVGLSGLLDALYDEGGIMPLICIGIHSDSNRKMEYGTAGFPDYKERGVLAAAYSRFVLEELLPLIRQTYQPHGFMEKAFAGFSLGGLSALDIAWDHAREFSKVGIFSGSFWWRDLDQNDSTYSDDLNRIMHQKIRLGHYSPWLRFFFECGAGDESEDRNKNGIIDSIDDTLDLIAELQKKGYEGDSIYYLELEDGRHDLQTWSRAMPEFLRWGWSKK